MSVEMGPNGDTITVPAKDLVSLAYSDPNPNLANLQGFVTAEVDRKIVEDLDEVKSDLAAQVLNALRGQNNFRRRVRFLGQTTAERTLTKLEKTPPVIDSSTRYGAINYSRLYYGGEESFEEDHVEPTIEVPTELAGELKTRYQELAARMQDRIFSKAVDLGVRGFRVDPETVQHEDMPQRTTKEIDAMLEVWLDLETAREQRNAYLANIATLAELVEAA